MEENQEPEYGIQFHALSVPNYYVMESELAGEAEGYLSSAISCATWGRHLISLRFSFLACKRLRGE